MKKLKGQKDYRAILGFTQQWFSIGAIDDEELQQFAVEYATGRDQCSEHYRYRAFQGSLAKNRPMSESMAMELYNLGAADPDIAMGGAMMADILYLRECPDSLLKKALASDHPHLVRIVERRQR